MKSCDNLYFFILWQKWASIQNVLIKRYYIKVFTYLWCRIWQKWCSLMPVSCLKQHSHCIITEYITALQQEIQYHKELLCNVQLCIYFFSCKWLYFVILLKFTCYYYYYCSLFWYFLHDHGFDSQGYIFLDRFPFIYF